MTTVPWSSANIVQPFWTAPSLFPARRRYSLRFIFAQKFQDRSVIRLVVVGNLYTVYVCNSCSKLHPCSRCTRNGPWRGTVNTQSPRSSRRHNYPVGCIPVRRRTTRRRPHHSCRLLDPTSLTEQGLTHTFLLQLLRLASMPAAWRGRTGAVIYVVHVELDMPVKLTGSDESLLDIPRSGVVTTVYSPSALLYICRLDSSGYGKGTCHRPRRHGWERSCQHLADFDTHESPKSKQVPTNSGIPW